MPCLTFRLYFHKQQAIASTSADGMRQAIIARRDNSSVR